MENTIAGVRCILLVGLYAAMSACSSSKHIKVSGWNGHKMIVDGSNNDWELPYSCNSKEHKIQYDIANDSFALYLTLKTSNDVSAYKISKAGLYIYVDTGGGRSEQMLLMCFAEDEKIGQKERGDVPAGNSMLPQRFDTPHVVQRRPLANTDALMVNKIFVSGFARCNGAYIGELRCKCRLQVAATINDYGEMVWELAIPYDMMGIVAAKEISVCIAMNALQEGDRPLTAMIAPMPGNRRLPMPAGGRGVGKPGSGELPPGAGREGPEDGGDNASNQARIDDLDRLTKVIHIWKRVKLSSGDRQAE